ncbi:MAG: DUF4012 domain-containing protein [Patescibacteria group bacterium]
MRGAVDGIRSAEDRITDTRPGVPLLTFRIALTLCVFVLVLAIGTIGVAISADAEMTMALRSVLPPGHYLVLFQNNAELRPSGGFIGSFAVVDIGRTGIERYQIDTNINKRDKAFTDKYHIALPGPMAQGLPGITWAMRDANWDLDFRDAARRVAWFYEQEGGEAVDGVIAINGSVVQDVLRLTGPITLAQLDVPLTADNFFDVLAKEIELDYYLDPVQQAANEPKSVLTKLLPALLARVREPRIAVQLPRLLRQELDENQVQLFQYDPALERRIIARGWAGEIPTTDGDYLYLNNAQIVGYKSSLSVAQESQLQIRSQADGLLTHQLTVERTHTGDGVWPDFRNNNYLRIVVPRGSQFMSATLNGTSTTTVDTTLEADKTVFGIWLTTDPGYTSSLQLSYRTPASVSGSDYELYYQKQSGVLQEQLTVLKDEQQLHSGTVVADLLLRPQ